MRHARLLATALLAAGLSLLGCGREGPLTARYPGVGERILAGQGFARSGDGFVVAENADPDPVKAAEASLAARGGLRLRLPADGASAATLSLPGGFAFEVREHGLAGAPQAIGGALAYPRADGASYWTATEAGYEEWLEVAEATEAAVAEWEVRGATLRQAGDAVELLDASGAVRVRVTAPQAFEAGGKARRAWLRASGGVLALFTDARGPALVDPAWATAGSMSIGRTDHSATLLLTGKVLVAGGSSNVAGLLTTCELYDPATGTWSATGSTSVPHYRHAAVLLRTGEVLVTSGQGAGAIAEVYDPASGSWSSTGPMVAARSMHTATLLGSGQVLVAGGNGAEGSAELYDPVTRTWSATGPLTAGRGYHTATLLPSGKVLVAGGYRVDSSEVYDPSTGTWGGLVALGGAHHNHFATLLLNGKVLIGGGESTSAARLYDPGTNAWTATGSLSAVRFFARAVLLPSGKVLAVGGRGVASAELYDPETGSWSSGGALPTGLEAHAVTMLPSGSVLVVGGYGGSLPYLASSQVYDPTTGSWSGTGSLGTARYHHTATLLASGKVLVAGGYDGAAYLASAELYDPAAGSWSSTGSMATVRGYHLAVLLRSGKVLVVGGERAINTRLASAELYDPALGTWSAAGSLSSPRNLHTATLLPSGKVLVAGGFSSGAVATAELYDPATGGWSLTGPLGAARYYHTATLLPSGKVLVAGGQYVATAELYDPATGTWSPTGAMRDARSDHTATLLPSGMVLVAAGGGRSSAELYDPASGTWSVTGSLARQRFGHTMTLLPAGRVLVAGGYDGAALADTEIYDPIAGSWSAGAALGTAHNAHAAVLLPSGKVLVAGGGAAGAPLTAAELYDEGLGATWAPSLGSAPEWAQPGETVTLGGTLFTGLSEGSGGATQSSAANHPLVELRDPETGSVALLPASAFTEASITLPLPSSLAVGRYWLTVIVNGVRSEARAFRVNRPPTASNGSASTPEDAAVQISLPATDADGDDLTSTVTTPPAHGSITGGGTRLTYQPDGNWNGTDTFSFTVSDGAATSAPATMTVTVQAINDAPWHTLPPDQVTPEDTPLGFYGSFSVNDVDANGGVERVTLTASNGTLTLSGVAGLSFSAGDGTADATMTFDGTLAALNAALNGLVFAPTPDFSGAASVQIQTSDRGNTGAGGVMVATNTVAVTVAPVNDPPTIAPLPGGATSEDIPLTYSSIVVGDVETPAADLVLSATSDNPALVPDTGLIFGGSGATRTLTLVPAPNASGVVRITVTVSDGTATASRTSAIIFNPVNDPPDAVPDAFTVEEDTPTTLDVLANDGDVDGDALTISGVTQPPNGTVTFTAGSVRYTPAANYAGTDSFTYTVRDPSGAVDTAPVSVTVNEVNDPPAISPIGDQTTPEDTSTGAIAFTIGDVETPVTSLLVTATSSDATIVPAPGLVLGGSGADRSLFVSPAANASGSATITVTVQDASGASASTSFALTVAAVNDAPDAIPDAFTIDEDSPSTLDVLANDTDVDGDALTVTSVTQPPHGTVTFTAGSLQYTPAANYAGTDSFTYTARDPSGAVDVAPVSITITPVNDAPVASDDSASAAEDSAVDVAVLLNDSDVDGDPLAVTGVTQPAHGQVTFTATSVHYAPDADWHGTDVFTYTVSDGNGAAATGTVTVTVVAVNDPPVAADDTATVAEDGQVKVTVLANDSDVDGDSLEILAVSGPFHGTVTDPGTGVLRYTPAADWYGTDTFGYTVSDLHGGTATATVTVTVTPVNDAPVALDDSTSTAEDTPVDLAVLVNDSDVDGDTPFITSVTQPAHGVATFTAASVRYAPSADWHGTDAFTYTVSDGNGGTAVAAVTVTVTPLNDAPVALDDSAATSEDTAVDLAVLLNDSDLDGDTPFIASVTQPAHGVTTFTATSVHYAPSADWHGTDTFTYSVSDGNGGTATASVTVTVTPVNDAPVAQPQSASVAEDGSAALTLVATDVDGDVPVFTVVTPPAHGTVSVVGATATYAPAADYHGPDAFAFVANDGSADSAPATVSLTVTPVNDAPVAQPQSVSTGEDSSLEITLVATDVDGDLPVFTVVTPPAHGTVSVVGAIATYTPAADYHGSDSFGFVASDAGATSAAATVAIDVVSVNDVPTANAQALETQEDSGLAVYLSGTDPDGDPLTFTVVTPPAHGLLVGSGASLSYIPAADFHGADSLTFVASDGALTSAPATVAIAVTPINDAPVALPQAAPVDEDGVLTVTLVASDVDGDALTYAVGAPPSHGTVTIAGAVATYVPAGDFHGSDAFTFVATDGAAASNAALVSIDVAPVNDPPLAQPISASILEDGPAFFLLTGTDVDGDPLTFTVVALPTHGTLSGSGANVTYTPAPDYHGTDAFTFKANDGLADSPVVSVAISIAPMNDPPVAQAQSASVGEDGTVDVALAATDVDGDALTYSVVAPPTHGTVTLSGSTATYTPAPDYHGPDAFTFVANDGAVDSVPATVSLTVAPVNDAPVAQAQSVATDEDVAVGVTLGGSDVDGDALTFTVVTPPTHGTLTGTGASLTYTPDPDFNGDDAFTFTVNDGSTDSAPATVSIAIAPVDDPVPSDPKGGCSCGTSGDVAPLGALLLGLLAVRRRRRSP